MLTASSEADLKTLGSFEKVLGGVVYGWLANDKILGDNELEVEVFANGLHIGTTSSIKDHTVDSLPDAQFRPFAVIVPTNLILDVPVTIRGRIKGTTYEIANPLRLTTAEEMNDAFCRAQGVVWIESGVLRGVLNKVNPDVLPLMVCVFANEKLLDQVQVLRPDVLIQRGRLLENLPFRIPLPTSILTGASTGISVRLEGSEVEFDGSPLDVAITAGTSFGKRITEIEATVEQLAATLKSTSAQIVADVSEQFHRYIIPRVDAIVRVQREMLEAQMIELWRQLAGTEKKMPRPGLPEALVLRMDEPFTGFGWSDVVLKEERAERWFNKTGFIAVNISSCHPLLLRLTGSAMLCEPGASGFAVSANGVRLEVVVGKAGPTGWIAAAIVPRVALRVDGVLGIQCSMAKHGIDPDAPGNLVSASVGALELRPLGGWSDREIVDIRSDATLFAHGWYDLEQTDRGESFRWMASPAMLVAPPTSRQPQSCTKLLELAGPFIFPDPAAVERSFRISLNGFDLPRKEFQAIGHGQWSARFNLPPELSLEDGGLLVLRAVTGTPQDDLRPLSLAVSHIGFVTAADSEEQAGSCAESDTRMAEEGDEKQPVGGSRSRASVLGPRRGRRGGRRRGLKLDHETMSPEIDIGPIASLPAVQKERERM